MPPTIVELEGKSFDDETSPQTSRASSECSSTEEELQDENDYDTYISQLTR